MLYPKVICLCIQNLDYVVYLVLLYYKLPARNCSRIQSQIQIKRQFYYLAVLIFYYEQILVKTLIKFFSTTFYRWNYV